MFAIAYRMLGSVVEAEDVLQDAWVRWQSATSVVAPEAWLTTTVSRLCLDRLKAARVQREVYVGPWLPEPLETAPDETDPESVSVAFLLLLERLTPLERAVFLLHRVFDYSHREIASLLQENESVVRQALHRAREHVAAGKRRFAPTKEAHMALLGAFAAASQGGDLAALRSILATDVKAWTDGGGRTRAARKVVEGADAVARLFVGLAKKFPVTGTLELQELNGLPAFVVWQDDLPEMVVSLEIADTLISAVYVLLNPDKLASLRRPE